MNLPSSLKIEHKAINVLERIIDNHLTMTYNFNSMDKEMSWDGYIEIYKDNNSIQCKRNFDDRLPVQIKGHYDKGLKNINKEKISCPVSLEDLNIYFNDRGVLYFQIFISEDGKQSSVFYSSLFPVKIKSYLDKAKQRNNLKSIHLEFVKLKEDPKEIYRIAKQFSKESRTQGFGSGPVVQNTITLKDMDKLKSISISAIGARNEYDFLRSFSLGDLCFYGEIEGNSFQLPIEWQDKSEVFIYKEMNNEIAVDGTVYFTKYMVKTNALHESIIMPSKNIEIDMNNGKINYKPLSSINELGKEAKFLLSSFKNGGFTIANYHIPYGKFHIPKKMKDALIFYSEMADTLSIIEFDLKKPFCEISEHNKSQILKLCEIKKGLRSDLQKDSTYILNWEIEGKYIPILILGREDNDEKDLVNAIYSKKYQMFITDEQNNRFRVTQFTNIDLHVLENLYYYDYEFFYDQIDKADVNSETIENLILGALRLIQIYDKNKDEKMLQLALFQLGCV